MNDTSAFAELNPGKTKRRSRKAKSNLEPQAGDNLNPEATFHEFRAELAAVDLSIGSLRDKRRRLCTAAKKNGIDIKAVQRVMKELTQDPDHLVVEHNALNHYRALVALPATGPLVLESGLVKDKDLLELAYCQGKRLGYRGGSTKDNPYDEQVFSQEWLRGFGEATKIMSSLVKPSVMAKLRAA